MDQASFLLPSNVKPQLIRSSGPPITLLYSLTLKGNGDTPLILLSRIAEDLRQTLAYVSGSDRSQTYGAADEEVLVEIDNANYLHLVYLFKRL